jgi:CHAT domain-containing protein
MEKFPLFYVPSASVLKFVSHKKRLPKPEVWVLAVGNPDLGSFNYDLPLAEMEVESMKWDFPKVDILIREKATESWVVKNIGRYDIIHFATHGEFDAINPLFSALKLAKEANYDGNLEVDEVFSLNLKADMVTLSACQTGLGKILAGDEIVGLNRAFIYAGTRSILSALWRVNDLATAVLIKHFYRNYSHLSKAESLQKAQILLMKYFSHPSYWAGLSLTGDYH